VKQIHRAADIPNAPYANVLVIGVAHNPSNARRFENALAEKLVNEKTSAKANHIENDAAVLSEEQVRRVIGMVQADAVIVSSIQDLAIGTSVEKSRTEVERTRKTESLVDFFRYDYKEVVTQEIVSLDYTVELITHVYDAKTGEKVYSLESTTMGAETTWEVIVSESTAIAKQLRKAGLVQ
jgi:hypothetical protein